MPLFQASVLKKFLSNQDTAKINTAYAEYSAYFHNGSIHHKFFLEELLFPTRLGILSANNQVELDDHKIKKLIEQVYQFSKLYWKSLRQQNVPITIKYPEMVAEIAHHYESGNIPPHGKEILWFL